MANSPASDVRPTLVTYLVLVAVVVVPAVIVVLPYALSVASGIVLAVLCQPLHAKLAGKIGRRVSGLVVTAGVVMLVLAPLLMVIVGGARQASAALLRFEDVQAPTGVEVVAVIRRWLPVTDRLGNPEDVSAVITSTLATAAESARAVVFANLQELPAMLLQLVLVVLATYFFLVDGERAFVWIRGKVPLSVHIVDTLVASFRSATTAVVLASVAAAGVQALCLLVAFVVLGAPAALLATSAAFVLAWIPTVGTVPVWGAAAIWLYAQGSPVRAGLMVAAGLAIGVVDNIVRPMVLRGRQEMHPMVSMLAILGGLASFGVAGAFVGPLLASIAISVLDIWPAVASYCGIAVSGAGDVVPDVPMLPAAPGDVTGSGPTSPGLPSST